MQADDLQGSDSPGHSSIVSVGGFSGGLARDCETYLYSVHLRGGQLMVEQKEERAVKAIDLPLVAGFTPRVSAFYRRLKERQISSSGAGDSKAGRNCKQ